MTTRTNAPESEALTLSDMETFENARGAILLMKKSFDNWVVIGRAVKCARRIADARGGRRTFQRLLEQQKIANVVPPATATRLLAIMDNLPEVVRWHETLTDKQQVEWASPSAVFKHCPVFAKPKSERIGPTPMEALKQANVQLNERTHELEEELASKEDGDRFKPTDTAASIAVVLIGILTHNKIQELIRELKKRLPESIPSTPKAKAPRKAKAPKADAAEVARLENELDTMVPKHLRGE